MLKCWEQDPDKRPSFAQAVVAIRNSPKELQYVSLSLPSIFDDTKTEPRV